ncbi:hypothetical protein IEQ34_004153 [Dendrobium chrysotoxum]|uniref:Uncharacterized protein n=1 Tax=Dendrobium chrysotoxum TaxID=161865 RepID=A0AAV7HFL0_DENCH|nr:hypothetical protein IEQ34_004153 [Dendrobium chrysotoxum]
MERVRGSDIGRGSSNWNCLLKYTLCCSISDAMHLPCWRSSTGGPHPSIAIATSRPSSSAYATPTPWDMLTVTSIPKIY